MQEKTDKKYENSQLELYKADSSGASRKYREKIKEYREKFKDKQILKFVDALEVILDWLDRLYETKRLSEEQKKEVSDYLPKEIFNELDKAPSIEISQEEYGRLKGILFRDISELINFVINISNLKMTDFDLLQFNLSQIFKKEEISTMIEWARLHLVRVIYEKEEETEKERRRKIEKRKKWLKKVREMPQKEMNNLIISQMFDFSPKARTNEERIEAVKNNQKKLLAQRNKFENFERKLIDASLEAKQGAQSMVYRKVGKVSREINVQADKFREKAKQIVSEEGIKKQMEKAQSKILSRREQLINEIKDKGKTWKDDFGQEISKAREKIFEEQKGLSTEQNQLRSSIKERGESEISKAKKMVLKGKADFADDVSKARKMFSGVSEEMDKARNSFIEKRDIASTNFTARGQEIKTEISIELREKTKKFINEREEARERFMQRAGEISQKAESHISEKKQKFSKNIKEAGEKFLIKAQEIRVPEKAIKTSRFVPKSNLDGAQEQKVLDMPKSKFEGEKLSVAAKKAESRISSVHNAMMEKAKIDKEKMKKEIMHRKELFLYDVRFARDNLQKRAKEFAEEIAEKREEFETRQQQVIARHHAHRKAMMIQNLLRTIRSIH